MKINMKALAAAATLVTAALGSAGTAQATSASGNNAGDVVGALVGEGYSVQVNGMPDVPLSSCTVTDVHGLPNAAEALTQHADPAMITSVNVEVDCPSGS